MSIKPTRDNILFEIIEEEEVTESGIIIPKKQKDQKPVKGVIKEVGPGRRSSKGNLIKPQVNVGMTVLIPKYAGHLIEDEGKEFILAGEKDIIAILEG